MCWDIALSRPEQFVSLGMWPSTLSVPPCRCLRHLHWLPQWRLALRCVCHARYATHRDRQGTETDNTRWHASRHMLWLHLAPAVPPASCCGNTLPTLSPLSLSLSLSRLLFSPACHNIVDVGLSPPRLPFPLPTAQPPATALRSIWFLANWFSDFRRKSQQHARGATKVAREGGGASTRCSLNTLWHLLCVLCAFRLSCLVGSQPDKTMKQSQTQSKSLSTSPSASLRLSLSYTEGREGTPYLTLTR